MAAFNRFKVRKQNLAQSSIVPNGNGRIWVVDAGGTDQELLNEPDADPPNGQVPVLMANGNTYQYCPYFSISSVNPVPLPDTVTITIDNPAGPLSVNIGDDVLLSASATINGNDVSQNVAWSSSIDGKIGYGSTLTVNDLGVGAHTITASITSQSTEYTDTESVTVSNVSTPPVVTIVSPSGGSYAAKSAITFSATAIDAQDGNISTNIRWYTTQSDKLLYQGQIFTTASLPLGSNTVWARCSDSNGDEGADSVVVVIVQDAIDQVSLIGQMAVGVGAFGVQSTVNTVGVQ